jgi:hypothetical protein
MAFLHFPGKSIEWKKAKLDDILDQLAAGKISIAGGAGDVNASFLVQASLVETKRKLILDLHRDEPDQGWLQHLETRQTRCIFADRWP